MATKEKQNTSEKSSSKYSATVPIVFACLILSICATMSFSSLYSDCFGLGNYIATQLSYVGFFDALIIIGFIFKLNPLKFMRFIGFAIAGFTIYLMWSYGHFEFAKSIAPLKNYLFVLFLSGNGIMAVSHFIVGLLSFRTPIIVASFIGIIGLAVWLTPFLYILEQNLS